MLRQEKMGRQAGARHRRTIEQAVALYRTGRLDEAAQICGAILAGEPGHFGALHLSGMVKHQLGQPIEALHFVAAALKANPGSAEALANYGVILEALERYEEALASYDRVLAMPAGDASLYYNRGNALKQLERYPEALASYDRAIALAPDLAVAHHGRGIVLALLDRHQEALASFDRVIGAGVAGPQTAAAWLDRAKALTRLKRFDEALASYDEGLRRQPQRTDASVSRAAVLAELGRYEEALTDLTQALCQEPNSFDAHLTLGNVYSGLTRMDEAVASYAAAESLRPGNPDANFNEALARLCVGDFGEGWRKYEYRLKQKERTGTQRSFPRPAWRGGEDLHGKTIALIAEQGMGDAIQFVRYAPLVAALGAKVLLGIHRPLVPLMETVQGVSQVIPDGGAFSDFDVYCPLLSLPLACGTELATIPAKIPYIRPDEQRITKWRPRLPLSGRLRVGICWAGNGAHLGDHRRSMPLEQFAAILSVSGIDFVSLQKDVSAAQSAILRDHGVTQLGQEFSDFADTAAVMAQLDLVISVDTSIAHLAGAMAKAVAVLVAFSPDWRWMLDRTDSPWYPTMRLFRQSAIGDWSGPLQKLRDELEDLTRGPRNVG
jgi:tetratricopeptide (TPR) repeat protein